jgi:hypothetical protein
MIERRVDGHGRTHCARGHYCADALILSRDSQNQGTRQRVPDQADIRFL